jgi:outer membrane protein TolC
MRRFISSSVWLLIIVPGWFYNQVNAQDIIQPINLETVLQIGGANNLTILEYKRRQELALADHAKAKEWWLPDIYAGASIHQLWGNAMNSDGFFFTDVNRQSFWGGLGLNASWDFGEGIFRANAAELKTKAAFYQTEAEKNQALLEMVEAYYDFLAAQNYYKAYEQLASQADTIAQQIEIQVKAGILFESDDLLAKSNYNHLRVEMLNARTEYNNKSANLTRLLNLDPNLKLVGVDSILVPIELVSTETMAVSFDSAYQNRAEIKSFELMMQSSIIEKKTTTAGLWLPELRLGTYVSYFGGLPSPLDPTSEINASLIWKIPLGRIAYGGSLKEYKARISLQENQIAQARAQVNEELIVSKRQITLAKEQMDIALAGGQFSEQALKQSIQRQQLGIVRPFEILQAQEIYIKSRLDYLKAVSSYNKAQYAYYVAMGNTL